MADILVNDSDWNSLSADVQSQIQSIVEQQFPGSSIVPSSSGLAANQSISTEGAAQAMGLSVGGNTQCVDNCNSMRDIALAACMTLGDAKAIGICIVATQVAAAICRAAC